MDDQLAALCTRIHGSGTRLRAATTHQARPPDLSSCWLVRGAASPGAVAAVCIEAWRRPGHSGSSRRCCWRSGPGQDPVATSAISFRSRPQGGCRHAVPPADRRCRLRQPGQPPLLPGTARDRQPDPWPRSAAPPPVVATTPCRQERVRRLGKAGHPEDRAACRQRWKAPTVRSVARRRCGEARTAWLEPAQQAQALLSGLADHVQRTVILGCSSCGLRPCKGLLVGRGGSGGPSPRRSSASFAPVAQSRCRRTGIRHRAEARSAMPALGAGTSVF
jgi:hypothetical protein